MKVYVNGAERTVRSGSTLRTIVSGEPYEKGALIAVRRSDEHAVSATSDFEVETEHGCLVIRLNDTPEAAAWRAMAERNPRLAVRWVTHDIVSFGSFPTDLEVDRGSYFYRMYDVFLALGGFDSGTTYVMIARNDHRGSYGAGQAVIGRITVGRHLLNEIKEGETVKAIRPVVSETTTENVDVTSDLSFKPEEGSRIETFVELTLDSASPASAEHAIILSRGGRMDLSGATGSLVSCSDDMDVDIPPEDIRVREEGSVTVRNSGTGKGRLYIYRQRRQLSGSHNYAGKVTKGMSILRHAPAGSIVTVRTSPARILAVGMTQKEGEEFLKGRGIGCIRTGDASDDAIIASQTPERTMDALASGSVETFGVPRERVFRIRLSGKDPRSEHYFRKVTGLSHKPIGQIKVQFTFEGLPMVTFYGDEDRGKDLFPQEPFKRSRRGDIGVTNQARPHHGLIGIRLQDSKDFGPTGEEPYGTNIIGRFDDDLDRLMDGLEDDAVVYITEETI